MARIWIFVLAWNLFFVWGQAEDARQNWWWEVRIEVSVRGEYVCVSDGGKTTGQYSFTIVGTEGMERDNGDYLLYPGESDIASMDWVEIGVAGSGSRVTNVGHLVKPAIKVNYVLREADWASFDFEISSAWLDMERGELCRYLLLPRSEENKMIHPKDNYNKDILEGDNRLRLKGKLLYKQNLTEGTARWRWERKEGSGRHEHTVECRILARKQLKR